MSKKGWYGNKYGHSLASKGIKINKEKFGCIGNFENFMIKELNDNRDINLIDIKDNLEWVFEDYNGNKLFLMMYSDLNGDINLQKIDAFPTGMGLGTKIIKIIKKYADKYGKFLYANEVENEEFCKKTGFTEVIIDDDFEPMYEGEVKDFKYYKYGGNDF